MNIIEEKNNEIDLLIDKGNEVIPIEIKSGQTYNETFRKGLKHWRKIYNSNQKGYVVYGGQDVRMINEDSLLNTQNILDAL